MSPKEQKKRHELDLLCKSGVGLTLIAPDVCRLVREIIGGEACSMLWMDAHGAPEGFFHEDALLSTQDLFLNEYERLFKQAGEINVFTLSKNRGARVGHLLNPPASYYKTNTFNLLVRPSNHHHCLDLRVDVDGQTRAVVLLFNTEQNHFDEADATLMNQLGSYLQRAVAGCADAHRHEVWRVPPHRTGHLVVANDNTLQLGCNEAMQLLTLCTLLGQDVRLLDPLRTPPVFIRQLCSQLAASSHSCARTVLELPGGQLAITASRLNTPLAAAEQMLVVLELIRPTRLQIVQRVLELGLSPLQREIALLAGVGGQRADCERVIGVSNEALKKHLRTIYSAAGVDDWSSLANVLSHGAARSPMRELVR